MVAVYGYPPHMLPEQRKIEGKCWHKKQGIWSINQGSDRNQTEIGRSKVTDIDYNTVAPIYYKDPSLSTTTKMK